MRAGAVISDVTTANNGEKKRAKKKKPEMTTDEKPVRAPAAMPAVDSIREAVGDVPRTEPITVAEASDNNAGPAFGILFSFKMPA